MKETAVPKFQNIQFGARNVSILMGSMFFCIWSLHRKNRNTKRIRIELRLTNFVGGTHVLIVFLVPAPLHKWSGALFLQTNRGRWPWRPKKNMEHTWWPLIGKLPKAVKYCVLPHWHLQSTFGAAIEQLELRRWKSWLFLAQCNLYFMDRSANREGEANRLKKLDHREHRVASYLKWQPPSSKLKLWSTLMGQS